MTYISTYEGNLERALIEAASMPELRRFMEPEDIETTTIDYGDGTRARVEALSVASVRTFIERIMREAETRGADLKAWICRKDEFDFCEKINGKIGDVMRQLDDFLEHKRVKGGREVLALVALFNTADLGVLLTLFGTIGFINNTFLNLCDCDISHDIALF